jgi:hypothetical protein
MQTFMPHDTYAASAQALDDKRLRNQRNECKVILRTLLGEYPITKTGRMGGWPHHPATKMWAGYESALCRYALAICGEALRRGWVKGDLTEFFEDRLAGLVQGGDPTWMGKASFHASHRSNLIAKDPTFYREKWPADPGDLPYVWPTKSL